MVAEDVWDWPVCDVYTYWYYSVLGGSRYLVDVGVVGGEASSYGVGYVVAGSVDVSGYYIATGVEY